MQILKYEPLEQKAQTMLAVEIAENKYTKDGMIYFEDQEKNILKLINSFYGYIKSLSFKYASKKGGINSKFTQQEIEQESVLAIYKALEKYDYKKCPEFFPYASQWIKAYARAYQTKLVSMFKADSRKAREFRSKISSINHLTLDEQVKILGISRSEYDLIHKSLLPTKSLLKKAGADSDEETEEFVSSNYPNPEAVLNYKELAAKILKIKTEFCLELDNKENDILNHLIAGTDSSFFITQKYGMTRQRVQQIKDEIKRKLRKRLTNNGIDRNAMTLIESGYDASL